MINEEGHRVGEVRTEETWGGFGPTVERTYDDHGHQISETRREETLGGFGPTVERTYDTHGKRISETRREETLGGFGPTVKREHNIERRSAGSSKYAPYGASPVPMTNETGSDRTCAASDEASAQESVRYWERGPGHKSDHRKDHRQQHVRDHR